MAKKVFLKDSDNVDMLPITRGELVLDSSGAMALHSGEFLATDSWPGLMSKEDKIKVDNMIATRVNHDLILKINSGTDEGVTQYIYNGYYEKYLNIISGNNISFATDNNTLTIAARNDNTTYSLDGGLNDNVYTVRLSPSVGEADIITIPSFIGASSTSNGNAGLVPISSYNNRNKFLKGDGTWSVPTDSHYTTYLYIGDKDSNSSENTTNGYTYLKVFDDSTLRNQYKITGSGNTTVSSDSSGNIVINTTTPTINWDDIANIPSYFQPASHTHSTNQITSLSGYSKAATAGSLYTTDTLNTALGKLEFKADLAYTFLTAANDKDGVLESLREILDVLSGIGDTDTIQAILNNYLPINDCAVGIKDTINGSPITACYSSDVNSFDFACVWDGYKIVSISKSDLKTQLGIPTIPNIQITDTGTATYVTDITASGHTITVSRGNIPATMKNPYALTINGTSYDGSSEVTVVTPDTKAFWAKMSAGSTTVAANNNDTFNFAAGDGISVVLNSSTKTLTITNTKPDVDHSAAHSHTVGTGLTISGSGGTSGTTTYAANLKSTVSLGTIGATSKLYAVGVDNNGNLGVKVPLTKSDIEDVLTGLITSHTHNYIPLSGSTNITGTLRKASDSTANLGSSTYPWNYIYGETIYESGTSLTSKYAAKTHDHGYISSDGKVTTSRTIANGDALLITDSSASDVVAKTSITFDGSSVTKVLSRKGTWVDLPEISSISITDTQTGTYITDITASNHTITVSRSNIPSITVNDLDEGDYISGITSSGHSITLNRGTFTDTKNTTGSTTAANTRLLLIGAPTRADSTITYTNSKCYIGSDNCLYSGGYKVLTSISGGAEATSGEYVSGITVSGDTITVTKETLPSTGDPTSYYWANINISTDSSTTTTPTFGATTTAALTSRSHLPSITNSYDIGSGTTKWRYIYGTYLGSDSYKFTRSYTGTTYTGHIYPSSTTLAYNIGTTSNRYQNGYFSASVYATSGFYESSDIRLKNIIKPLEVDLNIIKKIPKVYYTFKDDAKNAQHLGTIAQEILPYFPELVSQNEDGKYNVNYSNLVIVALAAIDKLIDENKSLREEINSIKTV